jgi:hypothetical protein
MKRDVPDFLCAVGPTTGSRRVRFLWFWICCAAGRTRLIQDYASLFWTATTECSGVGTRLLKYAAGWAILDFLD